MIEQMRAWLFRSLGIGRVNLVGDNGPVQIMQVQLSAAEARDNCPVLGIFGVSSNPPPGSAVAFAAPGGDRSQVFVVGVVHGPSRPAGTPIGGIVIFDQGGSQVRLNNDGTIKLVPSGGVVSITGALQVSGEVTANHGGSDAVLLSQHLHSANNQPPTPGT